MKVLYSGFNVYGQFYDDILKQKITQFTEISSAVTNFEMSYSFIVLKKQDSKALLISGFIKEKQQQIELPLSEIDDINQICCSDSFLLFLYKDGTVTKMVTENTTSLVPKTVTNFVTTDSDGDTTQNDLITKLSCGRCMNLALSKQGNVFSIPTKINVQQLKVIDIACGREHGVLLTDDGSVLTWGCGSRGQLGHGSLDTEEEPKLVEALAGIKIKTISAGYWHTAVISAEGDLYTWGWNSNGQLGFHNENIDSKQKIDNSSDQQLSVSVLPVPQVVDFEECNVLQVACGSKHTILLADNGWIYGCGWNKWGQLGLSDKLYENVDQPIRIYKLDSKKVEIKTGPWSSAICLY